MFESDDELEIFRRDVAELIDILNKDCATLRAKGFDVDGAIADLQTRLADLEKARAEALKEYDALVNDARTKTRAQVEQTRLFAQGALIALPIGDEVAHLILAATGAQSNFRGTEEGGGIHRPFEKRDAARDGAEQLQQPNLTCFSAFG